MVCIPSGALLFVRFVVLRFNFWQSKWREKKFYRKMYLHGVSVSSESDYRFRFSTLFKLDYWFRYFLKFPHSEIPSGALLFVFSTSEISSFLDFLSAVMMPLSTIVEIHANEEPLQIRLYDSCCVVFFLYFIEVWFFDFSVPGDRNIPKCGNVRKYLNQ